MKIINAVKCVNLTYHFILIDEKVICLSITTKNVLKFYLRMMQVFAVHWIFIRLPLMQFLMHILLQFNAVASFIRISYFTRLYVSRFSCIYNRYINLVFCSRWFPTISHEWNGAYAISVVALFSFNQDSSPFLSSH